MIYIVLDSNILHIDYKNKFFMKSLSIPEHVNNLIKMKKQGYLGNSVEILIPEVVAREVIRQRIEAYENLIIEVDKMRRSICGYGTIDLEITSENYRIDAGKQFFGWMAENDIKTIPICDEMYFSKIVDDALEKKPPFEGKEKQSDKGFKDVLIFYSIISFAKKNKGMFYFWSKDNIFKGNTSRDNFAYFTNETDCKLKICKSIDELIVHQDVISKEYIEKMDYRNVQKEYIWSKVTGQIFAKVTYSYPVMICKNEAANLINEDIYSIFSVDKQYWVDLYETSGNEQWEECEGNLHGIVTVNENGLLSIRFVGDVWLGGVINPIQIGRVYDLSTGCIMGMTQLLGKSESEIIELVKQKQKEDSILIKNKYWEDFEPKYQSVDDIKFYVDENGLFIYYDVYEASCGAAGNVEFKLMSKEELLEHIERF